MNIRNFCGVGTFVFLAFAIANHYVSVFRRTESQVLDVTSARIAFNIIELYVFKLTLAIIYAIILGISFNFWVGSIQTLFSKSIKVKVFTILA